LLLGSPLLFIFAIEQYLLSYRSGTNETLGHLRTESAALQ
jgi:hypothetical protein